MPQPGLRDYVCPGERHAISRAVHRARLAAGYAACRTCPLRDDDAPAAATGSLSNDAPSNHAPGTDAALRRLFTSEGVRGIARNDVDTATARRLATALAMLVWEEIEGEGRRPPAAGIPVVVGYDARPWSMPLAVAAGTALRQAGCESIDVGLVTGPELRFTVAHLEATAGLFVTGAGEGPAVTGFEFVHTAGRPLSTGGGLDRLLVLAENARGRTTRNGGSRREFQAASPYEAMLDQHFQVADAVCVVGTASPLVQHRLARLGERLPARIHTLTLPQRSGDRTGDPVALAAIGKAVTDTRADFGLWISEDGSTCRAVDGAGTPVAVAGLADRLLTAACEASPGDAIVVDWPLAERLPRSSRITDNAVRSNGTAEAMWLSLRDHAACFGADASGRLWHGGHSPTCDALIVLAQLFHVLTPDRSLSQIA